MDGDAQDAEAMTALVKEAFPDLKCLRCGHDAFFLRSFRSPGLAGAFGDVTEIELICQRCGLIERHAAAQLKACEKPIPDVGSDQ